MQPDCPNCGAETEETEQEIRECTACWWDSAPGSLSLPPGGEGRNLSVVEARSLYVLREAQHE